MSEEMSKVIDRRRLRSLRMAAKKSKTDNDNDPSAVAIATGIETSLLENLDSKGSSHGDPSEGHSSSRKLKKKKKNNSSSSDDSMDKKSKKKKKDVIAESLKGTTSKVPSLFTSPPKKKTKKVSVDSFETSKRKKGKAKKYKELEDGNSDSEDNKTGGTSSFDSPLPIFNSKSRSERDEGSLRDINIASPVDKSVSNRGSTSSQLKLDLDLGSLPTFGDSTIDDDETPFWKKNSGGSRRNSPVPDLEEDDTILTNDENNYFRFNKLEAKNPKLNTHVSPPPLSADYDSDEYESSSDESSSSSDGEPEWVRKKKMFESKGAKVTYKPPPPKEPEKSANVEEENKDDEPTKESLPPWANARKALKKTGSKRTVVSPTPAVKEKVDVPKKEEEQDHNMAGLPSWALPQVKKTGSARNITAAKTKIADKNDKTERKQEEKDNGKQISKAGVPSWAQNNRTSLKKTGSTRNTAASANDSEEKAETQKDENEGELDAAAKAGLPAWANARTSLKKSGSSRIKITETVLADTGNQEHDKQDEKNGSESDKKPVWAKKKSASARKVTAPADPAPSAVDESDRRPAWAKKKVPSARKVTTPADPAPPPTITTEPESKKSDGLPPWATATSSLRFSSTRSLKAAPHEEKAQNLETEEDSKEGSRPKSGGVPSWAKKKTAASKESSNELVELKGEGGDDKSKIEDNADSKGGKTAPKSVKERLSLWGNSNQSKPPKAMSERNVASSAGLDASSSRKAKMGKALSERSISGSVSVTSQGSQDSQGTSQSHRNRMAAYLGNSRSEHKNDNSKPPISPMGKNREQAVITSESRDKMQKKASTSVTPQKSNVRGVPPRPSGGNLSVKERTKAWGTSSQNSRDGDVSSVGTGGALSGTDPDDDEEKSVHSVKDRMKAWNQTTAAKSSQGIPTKVAITKSSDQDKVDPETLKPPSQFTNDQNPNAKSDHSRSSETDSHGRSKAKTWSAKSSPVPAYAAVALKRVKKDVPSSDVNDSIATPQLTRMYSSENLKKVNPAPTDNTSSVTPETIEPAKQKRPSFRREMSNSSPFHSRSQSNKSSSDVDKSENKPPIYASKLRKVTPPDASKWKSKKDTMDGSSHGVSSLRKVEKPNEQKWKEKKSAVTEDEAIPRASLRKVIPLVEKKWESSKTKDEEAGKLYSSQHERLRKVKPPIQEKVKGSDNANESQPKPESDASHLQSYNKTLIVLISSISGSQEQKSAQDRALTILKGMAIGSSQMETVDGADPKKKERRNELFGISGVRGNYPQFFLVDSKDKTTFLSDWEGFQSMHEMKTLLESMNLASSSKDLVDKSRDSSENSADEFAFDEAASIETPDQMDATMLEQTPIIDGAGEVESIVEAGRSVASDDDAKLCVNEEVSVDQVDIKDEITSDSDETASVSNVHGGETEISISQENDLSQDSLEDDADEGESLVQEDKFVSKNDEPCIENGVDGGEDSTQDAETEREVSAQEDEPQLASVVVDDAKKNESDLGEEEDSQLPEANDATSDDVKADISNDSNNVVKEKDDSEESNSSSDSEDDSSDDDDEEEGQPAPERHTDDEENIDCSEDKEFDSPTIEDDNEENESTPDTIVEENSGSNSDTELTKAVDGDEESDSTDTPHRWNEQSSIADSSESGAIEDTTAIAIASSSTSISPDENAAQEESTDSNDSETTDDADADEVEVPINFGREVPVNFGKESEDAMEKSKSEGIMKILEDSNVFNEDARPISLSSFFTGGKDKDGSSERKSSRESRSNDSSKNESVKKPMSVRSLSDHLSRDLSRDYSRGTNDYQSETSPVDEESSGGWSDDDSATIKSEFTDITYGTLGSAIVVDATATTTKVDAAKKLRRMVAAKAAASTEEIVPGLPPNLPPLGKPKASATSKSQKGSLPVPFPKASSGGDILFTPPRPLTESYESDSDNGKAAKKKKKKKPKKSKEYSSVDRDINFSAMFDDGDSPRKDKKKDKKKKKEKKKVATVQEDIVFDFGAEDAAATERSKKRKKKKKRKEDSGSGEDSQ